MFIYRRYFKGQHWFDLQTNFNDSSNLGMFFTCMCLLNCKANFIGKISSVAPPWGTWIKDIAQIGPRREKKAYHLKGFKPMVSLSRGMCSTAMFHRCPVVPLMLLWIELPDHCASAVANIIDVLFPVDLRHQYPVLFDHQLFASHQRLFGATSNVDGGNTRHDSINWKIVLTSSKLSFGSHT